MATNTIGLLYDTHVTDGRGTHDGVSTTKSAIDQLNSVGCDWVVHGGDLRPLGSLTSNARVGWNGWNGTGDAYHSSDFDVIKDLLDNRLNAPYKIIRGNHDRPAGVLREKFPPSDASPTDDLGRSDGYFGVETVDGVRYVYLDSNASTGYHIVNQLEGHVTGDQVSMLQRLNDVDSSIPTFVFIHNPLVEHTGLAPNYFETDKGALYEVIKNAPTVRFWLEAMNTQIVNAGHIYGDYGRGTKTVNGVEHVIARHLVHTGDSAYGGDVRWMTVDSTNNTAEVKYYDVGASSQGTITSVSW